jgi:hypothetical protein
VDYVIVDTEITLYFQNSGTTTLDSDSADMAIYVAGDAVTITSTTVVSGAGEWYEGELLKVVGTHGNAAYANDDEVKKESVDIHNTADQLIYQTENQMKEAGDKITDEDKKPIEDAVEQLKQANGGSDIDAIKTAIENLNKAWEPVAQKMYQAEQSQTAQEKSESTGTSSAKDSKTTKEGEVEDADFEVVEEG